MLHISIKKEHSKPSTLRCTRQDGSFTYAKIQLDFEIHDIAHYVVEKQLNLKHAFYGLLAQGFQIEDFMLPRAQRPMALQPHNLPLEALATEHLVNLLTIDFRQGDTTMDLSKTLADILEEKKLSFPEKPSAQILSSMRKELATLMAQWAALSANDSIDLTLEL